MNIGWYSDAICNQLDETPRRWFFGDDDQGSTKEQHERAAMFCVICPVREECLRQAMQTEEIFGVWGGYSPSQRKRYVARRSRQDRVLARAEVRTDIFLGERGYSRADEEVIVLKVLQEPLDTRISEPPPDPSGEAISIISL